VKVANTFTCSGGSIPVKLCDDTNPEHYYTILIKYVGTLDTAASISSRSFIYRDVCDDGVNLAKYLPNNQFFSINPGYYSSEIHLNRNHHYTRNQFNNKTIVMMLQELYYLQFFVLQFGLLLYRYTDRREMPKCHLE
jgi:hypothetical protein